jgi:hypothetical protein
MLWARMVAYVTGTVNQELPNWGWAIVVLTLVINKQLSGGATLRENTAGCASKFPPGTKMEIPVQPTE